MVLVVFVTPYGWRYPIQLVNNLILNPAEFHGHMSSVYAYDSIFNPRTFLFENIEYLITSSLIFLILLFTQIKKRKTDWTLLLINAAFSSSFI